MPGPFLWWPNSTKRPLEIRARIQPGAGAKLVKGLTSFKRERSDRSQKRSAEICQALPTARRLWNIAKSLPLLPNARRCDADPKKQADRLRINIHQVADIKHWTHPLSVPKAELRMIVEKACDSVIAVRKQPGIEWSDEDES
ncbi:DUF3606 domain-containing protein [Bradyrhizobium sp. JR3.5]